MDIRPFRLAADYVYAFLFEEGGKRVLIAMDELVGWNPPPDVRGIDLAVIPMGIVEFDPFTGERRIPENNPILGVEATFRQTLDIVRKMKAARVVISHIEEPDQLTYDDLLILKDRLRGQGLDVTFAHDTMLIDV